ncbi:DNA glycosylase [Pseudomassariella vexata]|uniref:DNA-(apurinic or apyrimidinic site) lyase n=1 Tax=Pseudomassariella vexata TaxID=1141098 RepID=A0A1Y2E6H0_9PEZI|nr:DNA glycosylase [Pseudomassariella vexata]ORY66465.1 DNA glycosylase [Pseudomassariella vexata]
MPAARVSEWRKLPVSLTELCIETTLRCGQSFRWRKLGDEWHMSLYGRILSLKQDSTHLHYKATWPAATSTPFTTSTSAKEETVVDDTEELVKHYFSLKHNAAALYNQWSQSDPNFRKKAPKFTGIRILSQDAWETLIGFICSSNNNISRISQMIHKLCENYGPLIGNIGDEAFHEFPTPEALKGKEVDAHLRDLAFGYRAKYIAETARIVSEERPTDWLESLTNPNNPGWGTGHRSGLLRANYKEAHEQLLQLVGVGPKVADCVCLMGLSWGEAVPVDTHIWQIAQRDYSFARVKSSSLSKSMYHSIGDHFRRIWGDQAGWAQSVLFTANLKSFSARPKAEPDPVAVKLQAEVCETVTGEVETKYKVEEDTLVGSMRQFRKRRVSATGGTDLENTTIEQELISVAPRSRKRRRPLRLS